MTTKFDTDGEYYSRREQEERAASAAAPTPEAKEAHARLADLYAEMRCRESGGQGAPDANVVPLPRVLVL